MLCVRVQLIANCNRCLRVFTLGWCMVFQFYIEASYVYFDATNTRPKLFGAVRTKLKLNICSHCQTESGAGLTLGLYVFTFTKKHSVALDLFSLMVWVLI